MKKFFCITCFICVSLAGFCQSEDPDAALKKIAAEKNDNARINLMFEYFSDTEQAHPEIDIQKAQKLLLQSQKNKDTVGEVIALTQTGLDYRSLGNSVKSLEYHLKAVAIAEATGNGALLAPVKNDLGNIYRDRSDFSRAVSCYLESRAAAVQSQNFKAEDWALKNLGAAYLLMNKIDSAFMYSQMAYKLCLRINYTDYLSDILTQLGGVQAKMKNESLALSYYDQAIREAKKKNSIKPLCLAYTSLAQYYFDTNQKDLCRLYAKKAIQAVEHTSFSNLSIKPAQLLADIYKNTNCDSTLKYSEIYRTANDSLFNIKTIQQTQLLTFEEELRQQQLEFDKKKSEVKAEQEKKDALAQKEIQKQKLVRNGFVGGFAVVMLFAGVFFTQRNKIKKGKKRSDELLVNVQTSIANLKATQSQLIHSEKMASLGELTAGIAHEIQNPLNFVNNFSAVNAHLIAEMKAEIDKGNLEEAKAIAKDISENEKKITQHGKRADAIVKGMLQHSSSSSGQKRPIDINALADEYLRLAYHGLRAKDELFIATLKTDFDETIGNIPVIPQDIGRVLLNLITNAFYAVAEKKKQAGETFEPTVSISTKKRNAKVEVKVKDNGNGIPQNILDKIFQPFFTTKPVGEGTGLGLSLSYDIIKAHGGELKLETSEGEGAVFIIYLPLK